jgi:hypothetical protein
MRIACWVTKATSTLSEYIIIIGFPHPQWLQERAPMLHYRYNACLISIAVYFTSVSHMAVLSITDLPRVL